MKQKQIYVDFFLGSNSETGFVSHFAQLQNPDAGEKAYILKGGPGTGKSSLMKKLGKALAQRENYVERIHCSSDPDSLDAVCLPIGKTSVLDGTPPHAMEPRYPGAVEMPVNLLDCMDEAQVEKNREEIVKISRTIAACHKKFCELLRCANVLLDENRKMIYPFIDSAKIRRTVERIVKRECRKKNSATGIEKSRMLSAFTPDGLVTYEGTVNTLCKNVYFINDEYRVCAPYFMELLKKRIKEAGYTYYICYSPWKPKEEIDHILIPELSLAFVTVNRYIPMDSVEPSKVIHATRFIEKEIFKIKKQRFSFYKKTANEVLQEGIKTLKKAKEEHDVLESYYIPAMDFEGIDLKYEKLLEKLNTRYPQDTSQQEK